MGLWLIQECRRDWQKAGQSLSWNDIVEEAKKAEPFRSIIEPDYGEFFAGGRMVEKIQDLLPQDEPAGARDRRPDRAVHLRISRTQIPLGIRASRGDQGPAHRYAEHRRRRLPE